MARDRSTAATEIPSVRHGRLPRSVSWLNAVKAVATVAVVLIISVSMVAAYAVFGLVQQANTVELYASPDTVGVGTQSLEGELTLLLVGTDHRKIDSVMYDGEEGDRNDVNLLVHVPADHQSATVVSFPRDLMLPIPSCTDPETGEEISAMSEQQINTAMSYGGLACVAATITELTGLEIPFAAAVDFDGVIDISTAIGGVNVCLAEPIEDPETGMILPAGDVSLVGVEALNFLRTRYGVGDGSDISRISNQQIFMSALLRQLRSGDTLSNPVSVYRLAKVGFDNLTLSSSMASIDFLQKFAATMVDIELDRVNFVQYPTYAHPYQQGRVTPDVVSGDHLIEVMLSGEPFVVLGSGEAVLGRDVSADASDAPAADETDEGEEVVPADPDQSETVPSQPQALPPHITGQSAAEVTCSAGRTVY